MEVKALFFNVPVRRKFQKSPAHDVHDIQKMVMGLALGYSEVKFALISDQETLLNAPVKTSFSERIASVLGEEFTLGMCDVDYQTSYYALKGSIGLPTYTRHNRTGQFLFINKRNVVSPLVAYSVREGYGTALASQRHPIFVLHLAMQGDLVDINVHPQKKEVRLRQEQALKQAIVQAIEQALQQGRPEIPCSFPAISKPLWAKDAWQVPPPEPVKAPIFTAEPIKPAIEPRENRTQTSFLENITAPVPVPKVLGTIAGYILTDSGAKEGISLVDQRAAHCRIIYEKLLKEKQAPALQILLIPHTLETSLAEASLLRMHLESLNAMGIAIKEFGAQAFIIDAIPEVFGNNDLDVLMCEILDQLKERNSSGIMQEDWKRRISMAASRSSVNRQRRLTIEEAQGLLLQLFQCQTPLICPQGRPTIAQMPRDKLVECFFRV
jgi:DNA mismatch repair protein MutL